MDLYAKKTGKHCLTTDTDEQDVHTVIDFLQVLEDPLRWIFALVSVRNLSIGVLAHLPVASP